MKILLMTSSTGIGFSGAPPMGLYRLKNFLNGMEVSCDILDSGLSDVNEYLDKAGRGEYQIIGMSVSHVNMLEDISTIWKFKQACQGHNCLIIAGGQEATYNYENWIRAGVDVIFLGLAEKNFTKFVSNFKLGFEYGKSIIHTLDGIAYRQENKIVFKPTTIMTQAEFEYLNYEKVLELDIPFETYWESAHSDSDSMNFGTNIFVPKTVRLYTSSHCPNRCGFCSAHRFLNFSQQKKTGIFMLDAKQIFDMILKYIQKYDARGFLFGDDEFLVNKKRTLLLCDKIIKAKRSGTISKDIIFNCQARVSDFLIKNKSEKNINYELIEKLSEAGFYNFGMGIETFSDRLLLSPSMNKKGFIEKDSLQVISAVLENGLIPTINLIIFIPETTKEEIFYSIRKAMHFIRKGSQLAVTPVLYALPGSPIYDKLAYPVVSENWKNPETDELIKITKYLIPHDPEIAYCAEQIFDVFNEKIEVFKNMNILKFKKIPKVLVGILLFISVAELFGNNELTEECWELINFLIINNEPFRGVHFK